ncbi:MAG TPA: outer membrane beta-barrel protein [Stellaceae bacterium]|nr:outer membrane beta-barrel protein [Stellaceae bacterium]
MKSTLLASAAAVALGVASTAPAQAQSIFDGFYAGVGVGYHHFDTGTVNDNFIACCASGTLKAPSQSAGSAFGDLFAGYGVTLGGGPFYVGGELDGSYSGASKSFTINNSSFPEGVAKIRADWGAGASLRLGYLINPNILGYLRGGVAFQRFRGNWTTNSNVFDQPAASGSSFATGGRLGGGLDFSLASWTSQPLFARLEYDHTFYGNVHFGGPGPTVFPPDPIFSGFPGKTVISFNPSDDRVMVAIVWRFLPPQ